MQSKNNTFLKSVLWNLSLTENNNENITREQKQYYKGLIVGIVSSLMDNNVPFLKALSIVKENLPDNHVSLHEIIPDWEEGL